VKKLPGNWNRSKQTDGALRKVMANLCKITFDVKMEAQTPQRDWNLC